MLTCAALGFLSVLSAGEIAGLAADLETDARALTLRADASPALIADLSSFSRDADHLAAALNSAGVEQDMPCMLHAIALDARASVAAFAAADTRAEEMLAFMRLRLLLEDTIALAPLAAGAAADRQIASR